MKKSKFTKTQSVERRRKEIRYFSEEARRAIVNEIDEGNISKAEASRKYAVSQTANSPFSILNSQFSILNSQFSILNSQFSILNSQFYSGFPQLQNNSKHW